MNQTSLEDTTGPQDWTALFQAFSAAFEWALDLAGGLARAYPAEVATVERVRTFVHRRIAGDPAHIRVDDLLFTLGLIAGAIERDVRPVMTAPARTLRAAPRVRARGTRPTPFSSAAVGLGPLARMSRLA